MATEDNEYFTDIIDTLNKYQNHHGQRFPSKKLKEAVLCIMVEEEEEMERGIIKFHTILHLSLQLLSMYKRKMQIVH